MDSVDNKTTWRVPAPVYRIVVRTTAICLILIPVVFLAISCRTHMTAEQIDQLIRRDAPRGSSKSQVIAFLDSHRIEHSDYSDDPTISSDFRYDVPDSKKPSIKGYLAAIVRDVRSGRWEFFTTRNLQMHFYFDDQGNLVEYTLKELSTKS